MYLVYSDASIKPFNPGGLLVWGFLVKLKREIIYQKAEIVDWKITNTNNLGEILGVYNALLWLVNQKVKYPALINSDSQLIINQCNQKFKCHKPELKEILDKILKIVKNYEKPITFNWIPREKNGEADLLSRSLYPKNQKALAILKANELNIVYDWDDITF